MEGLIETQGVSARERGRLRLLSAPPPFSGILDYVDSQNYRAEGLAFVLSSLRIGL